MQFSGISVMQFAKQINLFQNVQLITFDPVHKIFLGNLLKPNVMTLGSN